MNEIVSTTEQKLWYDGPNYTADSIVIHPESQQVLLVKRKTGEWALNAAFAPARELRRSTGRFREQAREWEYQPPMIFMMVAPPENATSCLSPKAFTSKRCSAGSAS